VCFRESCVLGLSYETENGVWFWRVGVWVTACVIWSFLCISSWKNTWHCWLQMFIAQLFFRQFQHITHNSEGLLIKYVKLKWAICKICSFCHIFVSLEHKRSHKQHSYICRNSQQYIVWLKIIHFYFM